MKEGDKIGVAGIGGLGHLAIKLAKARGAEVYAFTTSPRGNVKGRPYPFLGQKKQS